jgi:two-component system OmpR family sensor kinase
VSLRSRLLIAIGVIFVVALVAADLVTYSALESFLYNRVDMQLAQASSPDLIQHLDSGQRLPADLCAPPGLYAPPSNSNGGAPNGYGQPGAGPGGTGGDSDGDGDGGGGGGGSPYGDGDGDGGLASNAVEEQAVWVRSSSGAVVNGQKCSAYVDGKKYAPAVPITLTGLTNQGGVQAACFTAPSTNPSGPAFRVQATMLSNGDQLIVAQPLADIDSTLHDLLLVELAVTGAALLIALIGGWWLVRIGLRPLRDMEATAGSIAAGNLTERVPGENDKTEVGRLARTLNVMLARIESAFGARLASERRLRASEARLRRFVADASHELRTPIAAISAYAELFGRGASEQKADLERVMGGIRTETSRMEHLVSDLLLLARLDEGRPMERRSVDLVALCAEAVNTASTVGPDWPVTFHASRPIEVMGDAISLRQVVDNLLANVRAHTPAGTTVRVSVEPEGEGAVLTVADNGPGMDPEQAEHVFERFYRSDPSRSRVHGGAGLGLSIVSAIVASHGGTVSATGAIGVGTTVTVHLPAAPPPEVTPTPALEAGPDPDTP